MIARSESLFAPNESTDKRAFQEKGEHTFHRQRLPYHSACITCEVSPIGPELKFHRNTGDDANGKIKTEDLCPKPGRFIVLFLSRPERPPFPINQKPSQPHGELRKQIMVR